MLRIILVAMAMFFGLTACSTLSNLTSGSTLRTPEHPDGDIDNKGYDHFPMTRPATGNKVFIFDPNFDAWAVYDKKGRRVDTGKASGGSLYCPDLNGPCQTIVGQFSVISKEGAGCISHTFPLETHGGAPMPYCMYFSPEGYAIHGSYELPDHNASHGCIRVTPVAAKWLNEHFITIGTTVIVLPYATTN